MAIYLGILSSSMCQYLGSPSLSHKGLISECPALSLAGCPSPGDYIPKRERMLYKELLSTSDAELRRKVKGCQNHREVL